MDEHNPIIDINSIFDQPVSERSKQMALDRYSWEKTGQPWLALLSEMEKR